MSLAVETKINDLVLQVANEARRCFGLDIDVYWFGSWVNGSANKRSDIDIALNISTAITPVQFMSFVDWVEQLPTLYKFDIINMSDISDEFREKIIKTGQKI